MSPYTNEVSAKIVVNWCIKNMGVSHFHVTTPKIEISKKKKSDRMGEFDEDLNTIIIFKKNHNSLIEFIRTIIHEYVHYLQDPRYSDYCETTYEDGEDNPIEVEAEERAQCYASICKKDIMSIIESYNMYEES
jgi:Zn-dependent peptidase ImmA (M78 family)